MNDPFAVAIEIDTENGTARSEVPFRPPTLEVHRQAGVELAGHALRLVVEGDATAHRSRA
jgi:hypothetical protein